jgi:hypothetical protein
MGGLGAQHAMAGLLKSPNLVLKRKFLILLQIINFSDVADATRYTGKEATIRVSKHFPRG